MAINYEKINNGNGWDTRTSTGPTNFNHMEEGIKSACDGVDNLEAKSIETDAEISEINQSTDSLKKYLNNGISLAPNAICHINLPQTTQGLIVTFGSSTMGNSIWTVRRTGSGSVSVQKLCGSTTGINSIVPDGPSVKITNDASSTILIKYIDLNSSEANIVSG